MNILKDTKNSLLKRREIQFTLESSSNPGFKGSKQAISRGTKAQEDNIAIKFVKNNFGANEFLVEAFIYDSKEDKERIEPKPKAKKNKPGAGG
ncbi:MAG: hypothetical protein ABIH92_02655 [Nanoarchaeota archaeon]